VYTVLENARQTIRSAALAMIREKESQIKDTVGGVQQDILDIMVEENRKATEMDG
jgi:hypothetical protein